METGLEINSSQCIENSMKSYSCALPKYLITIGVASLLSACGGGGGSGSDSNLRKLNVHATGCEASDELASFSDNCYLKVSWDAVATELVYVEIDDLGKIGLPVGINEMQQSYAFAGAGIHTIRVTTSQASETTTAEIRCQSPMTIKAGSCVWTVTPATSVAQSEIIYFGDEQKIRAFDTSTKRITDVQVPQSGDAFPPSCGCYASTKNLPGGFPLVSCNDKIYFIEPARARLHAWEGSVPSGAQWYRTDASSTTAPFHQTITIASQLHEAVGIKTAQATWLTVFEPTPTEYPNRSLFQYDGAKLNILYQGPAQSIATAPNCRFGGQPNLLWISSSRGLE